MANHITQLRVRSGFETAKKSAQKLGISAGMMYQMEEGLKRPGSLLAIRMAELFGCKLEDIFLPFNTTNSDNKAKEGKERDSPLCPTMRGNRSREETCEYGTLRVDSK